MNFFFIKLEFICNKTALDTASYLAYIVINTRGIKSTSENKSKRYYQLKIIYSNSKI